MPVKGSGVTANGIGDLPPRTPLPCVSACREERLLRGGPGCRRVSVEPGRPRRTLRLKRSRFRVLRLGETSPASFECWVCGRGDASGVLYF